MLHILALFLAALSALGAPTPQKSTSLPMRAVKRDGGIQLRLVLVEHDDAEIYFKTPYARGRVREEHGARVFDLAPGEDLTAKPISFTQVTRATQDGGKHKTEHECKIVGIAQRDDDDEPTAIVRFWLGDSMNNYLYPCGKHKGLTAICGQQGLKGNPASCDGKAWRALGNYPLD